VELIRQVLVELGCGTKPRNPTVPIGGSPDPRPGRQTPESAGGFCAGRILSSLILARRDIPSGRRDDGVELSIPGMVTVGRFQIESRILSRDDCDLKEFLKTKQATTEWFDFESIVPPLRIRRRRPGDRFIPLGQTENKKIGKFLTTQKAADALRRRILIVEDVRQILWAAPLRISHSVRIQSQTRRILEIAIRPVAIPPA
jgi:tRNA(Ile)-lysidine synthase